MLYKGITCPFFVVICLSIVSGLVFPIVISPLQIEKQVGKKKISIKHKRRLCLSFHEYLCLSIKLKEGAYVFLSRNRMEILLTSASETCNLRIPPDRISTAET